jgi:hypothetical protein
MDWFRWWHGTVTDPKFQWVSRRCGLPLAEVIAVWACLLECASTATQGNADATRGNVASFDCNDYDVLLGLEDGQVEQILTAMKDKKLIVEGRIAGWDGRQPKREDSGNPNTGALSSTERSRNYREKKKLEETQRNEVQRDATQGNDRREEIREEEIKETTKTKAPRAKRATRPSKTPLPSDFSVSDRVRDWAAENGHVRLEEHFESFVRKARAKGYEYASWDDAFMEAIRGDWAGLKKQQGPPRMMSWSEKNDEVIAQLTGRNRYEPDDRTIDV